MVKERDGLGRLASGPVGVIGVKEGDDLGRLASGLVSVGVGERDEFERRRFAQVSSSVSFTGRQVSKQSNT